jgi:hypothetical protein
MAADYHLAVDIAELGLVAAPDSAHLMNDCAFALANLGRLDEATNLISKARSCHPSGSTEICLTATEGLVRYRRGNRVGGSEKYQAAFDAAAECGATELIQRGLLHWIYEELRAGADLPDDSRKNIMETFSDEKRVEPGVRDIFDLQLRPLLERQQASDAKLGNSGGREGRSLAVQQLDRIGNPPPIRVPAPRLIVEGG